MEVRMSYRQIVRELAFENHGIVTVDDARDAGVPAAEVRKLASRGALARLGQGVYRSQEAPADRLEEFAAAVALVGRGSVLADDSVLAAWGLGQVNLRRIRVMTAKRVRKNLPQSIEVVVQDVPEHERDTVEGIPSMSLSRALLSSRNRVMTSRLVDAARRAAAQGLLDPQEAESVIVELERA